MENFASLHLRDKNQKVLYPHPNRFLCHRSPYIPIIPYPSLKIMNKRFQISILDPRLDHPNASPLINGKKSLMEKPTFTDAEFKEATFPQGTRYPSPNGQLSYDQLNQITPIIKSSATHASVTSSSSSSYSGGLFKLPLVFQTI